MPLVYDKHKDAELTIQEVEERDKQHLEDRIRALERDIVMLKDAMSKLLPMLQQLAAPKRKKRSKAVVNENKGD